MQIVIDIPEDVYKYIKQTGYLNTMNSTLIAKAIMNGGTLPKGHGRLIDADDIALIDEQFCVSSDYYVAENAINDAQTIIAADKVESEEQE